MDPRIETAEVKPVGVQGILRVDRDFGPDLQQLYDRPDTISDISSARWTFGYWHCL